MSQITKKPNITGALSIDDKAPQFATHKYDQIIKRDLKLCKKKSTKLNYILIEKWQKHLINDACSKAYICKSIKTITNLNVFLDKDWTGATKEDIDNVVTKIMIGYADEKNQESCTSYDHKKFLRLFFRFVKTGNRSIALGQSELPELLSVRPKRVKDRLSREDLFTEDDKTRMIHACNDNIQLRAFIDVIYDGGIRPSEAIEIRLKHISQDEQGWTISVDGKTNARPIHLATSANSLAQWIDVHPYKDNPEWPLWIITDKRYYGRPWSWSLANKYLKEIAKKAEIKKRVYLNLFRHSEVTRTSRFMSDAILKKRHGWSAVSKQPARYTHLISQDVREAINGYYKINSKPQELPVHDKKCQYCSTSNSLESTLCIKCTRPLDEETAHKLRVNQSDDIEVIQKEMIEMKKLFLEKSEIERNKTKIIPDDEKVQKVLKFMEEQNLL